MATFNSTVRQLTGLHNQSKSFLKDCIHFDHTEEELEAVRILEKSRPGPLRSFDQISMLGEDMLKQVKTIMPYMANKKIVFVGDNDGAAILLGLLSLLGYQSPSEMLVVDFDGRVLRNIRKIALAHGFADKISTALYNVFDPIPKDLEGHFDWYYTNPPYGSRNDGESARLFVARGSEFVKAGGSGCIILPDDEERFWTRSAMRSTQKFIIDQGWEIGEKIDRMHRYHLDDDRELTSTLMLVNQIKDTNGTNPYAGRRVGLSEIPHFYGASTPLPYPRYIHANGSKCSKWDII